MADDYVSVQMSKAAAENAELWKELESYFSKKYAYYCIMGLLGKQVVAPADGFLGSSHSTSHVSCRRPAFGDALGYHYLTHCAVV